MQMKRSDVIDKLYRTIDQRYKKIRLTEPEEGVREMWLNDNGVVFFIPSFGGDKFMIICYANDIGEAENHIFEDGDEFWFEDFKDADEMIKSILEEIEGEEHE